LGNVSCAEFFDIFMLRDFWPVLFENAQTEFVDFTLKGDFESSAFEAEVETANSTKKGSRF